MPRKLIPLVVVLLAGAAAGIIYLRHEGAAVRFTGFVEGEERVMRSEVSGRVLEVKYGEGASVAAREVIAVVDDRDMQARIRSKREELAVLDAELRAQAERVQLVESTWQREVSVRQAERRQAESAAELAARTLAREETLVRSGLSTAQSLDDHRARRDQADSALQRARELLARSEAEVHSVALARHELATLEQKRQLLLAQLAELEVTQSKYVIRAPDVPTVLQTQFVWPGELAQPGTAVAALLDPADKYVQIYVPVAEVGRLQIGQRVSLEVDSRPGERVPGEVSFIADKANFTPEKIETRSDRMGQVYRVKIRILEGVERLQPGTEGNVYLDS
ncbi:MAG: HlyD family efflux transporter periplasmic adaptor subunit [Deltaproteobacteria bacterium]|nr:HlyD family efflux transporter periplasmic adaptor subunit [Deltaproteobacteria bacterium]